MTTAATPTPASTPISTAAAPAMPMLPYRKGGEIDYASLEFDPDRKHMTPDAMEQNQELVELLGLLAARFTDFNCRPDVFLDNETYICYEPSDLNVRVSPDIYLAFGVDAGAIRPRRIYLPWEVGKPPDWALEVASGTTAWADVNRKPGIYAAIGIAEYWRFDPGGRYHGAPLWGGRLVNGRYEPVELTTEPDGVLKGYSAVLGLSVCWDEGWPRLYDPATGEYDENWRQERAARQAAEGRWAAESVARTIAETARDYAEMARANAEAERAAAELARDNAEAERADAELARDNAEAERADAAAEAARLREKLRQLRESN